MSSEKYEHIVLKNHRNISQVEKHHNELDFSQHIKMFCVSWWLAKRLAPSDGDVAGTKRARKTRGEWIGGGTPAAAP